MNVRFGAIAAGQYRSQSQIARVLSESWVSDNAYCPSCGFSKLERLPNNRPVADFNCEGCNSEFELKSKAGAFGKTVVDGAYETMLSRLRRGHPPHFMLLNYDKARSAVTNLYVVPGHFFVESAIRRRKPLSPNARRAGWVGCNISLGAIPEAGRIYLVRDSTPSTKTEVLLAWQRTVFLRDNISIKQRGWTVDVWSCVEEVGTDEFTLADIYRFENKLRKLHPNNRHVRAKIRQQLQILRDAGFVDFLGRGKYRLYNSIAMHHADWRKR